MISTFFMFDYHPSGWLQPQLEYSRSAGFVQTLFDHPSKVQGANIKEPEQNSTYSGIFTKTMLIHSKDTIGELALRKPVIAPATSEVCEIERKVIGLFDQFRNPLLRYTISFGLSVHDGEEIIQEVFLALFRHLRLGKSRRNLRSWMFRVAHNLALKQRAANKRLQDRHVGDPVFVEEQSATNPNPEECAASDQAMGRLHDVVRSLPDHDRRCLLLRAEGLRYREIATTLGISLGSVSISLTRSLGRLRSATHV